MMAVTHAAIAVAGTSLCFGETTPISVGLAVIGSQLPDIDTTKSLIGRFFYPVARWFEERYPHRTITHSLLATAAIALVTFPLGFKLGFATWAALPLGHLIACFSDTFTKEGVGLFFPYPERAIYGNNPNYRLRTGSTVEYWVLALFVLLSVWLLNLQSAGGLLLNFNQLLGSHDGVEQTYNRYGGAHHVWIKVKGYRLTDLSPVDDRFFLVGPSGSEFVLQDRDGLYKTGEQIAVERMNAIVGAASKTTEQNITFNDDSAIALLKEMGGFHPDAAIYLSGTLEVDEGEELQVNIDPGRFKVLRHEGNKVTLEFCPLEQATLLLKDQFAYGTLTAKIVTPQPRGF